MVRVIKKILCEEGRVWRVEECGVNEHKGDGAAEVKRTEILQSGKSCKT